MSAKPYSDPALRAASDLMDALYRDGIAAGAEDILIAAHDRKELGLDASVCARTFLNEIVTKTRAAMSKMELHEDTGDRLDEGYMLAWTEALAIVTNLPREFGDWP